MYDFFFFKKKIGFKVGSDIRQLIDAGYKRRDVLGVDLIDSKFQKCLISLITFFTRLSLLSLGFESL